MIDKIRAANARLDQRRTRPLPFWQFMVLAFVLSAAVTAVLVAFGVNHTLASIIGTLSILGLTLWDLYFNVYRPHRSMMKRYDRIEKLLEEKEGPDYLVKAIYLLGLNRDELYSDDAMLRAAIKELLNRGIDPQDVDEGRV